MKTCYSRFTELENFTVKGEMVTALPQTFTAEDRVKIFLVKGGAGVADEVHIIIKDAAGAYVSAKVTIV